MLNCPSCSSAKIKKNGFIETGKQNYLCNSCGRQFVENPGNKIIPEQTWKLVDNLLLEKIPISGISRVTGISELWLQKYVNNKYKKIEKSIKVPVEVKKIFQFPSNVTKCGHSLETKKISNGFGLQLTKNQEKLLDFILEIVRKKAQKAYGILSQKYIENWHIFIVIFGNRIEKFFQKNVILLLEST